MHYLDCNDPRVDDLVRQDIICSMNCVVDALVKASFETGAHSLDEFSGELEQMVAPIEDWVEPAEWHINSDMLSDDIKDELFKYEENVDDNISIELASKALLVHLADCENYQEFCDENGIEPHITEVFEYWSVSSFLGKELVSKGDKVVTDFFGHDIWCRTTTGQCITMDGVIRSIAHDHAVSRGDVDVKGEKS
ncbi:MAG: hypothetical protein JKY48_15275 [Flavobacteriales bacterium]|nr:hypothetical protein [Flavobacteriales bacterium]